MTSRLIVMSYPAEGLESAYRNHIEDVKAFLDSKQSPYIVVNISGRSYGYNRFGSGIKVFDGGPSWKDMKRAPTLLSVLSLCQLIQKWMSNDNKNFTVIHCMVCPAVVNPLINVNICYLIKGWKGKQCFFECCPFYLGRTLRRLQFCSEFLRCKANPNRVESLSNPLSVVCLTTL